MEGSLNECTTGILIDFEEGNIAEEKSMIVQKNDIESDIDEFHLNLHEHSKNAKKEQSSSCEKSSCITGKFKDMHIGAEMIGKKEMLSVPRKGWKTPSPKSMNIIRNEASKIIDKLHSSPIESTEALLVDEDFPIPFSLQEDCLDEFSPESEKFSEKKYSTEDIISELQVSRINDDIPSTIVLEPEVSEPADIQVDNPLPKNIAAPPKRSKAGSIPMKSKNMHGIALKTPLKRSEMNKENASERKSCIDADLPLTIVLEPEISEPADIQVNNSLPKNIAAPPKHSKAGSIPMKSKNMHGIAFKTPLKSSKINEENASERKSRIDADIPPTIILEPEISEPVEIETKDSFPKNNSVSMLLKSKNTPIKSSKIHKEIASERKTVIPKSGKNIFKSVLGDRNTSGIGMLKSKPNMENSSKESCTAVIPGGMCSISNRAILHNVTGSNKKSSIIPRTSNAVQYQPASRQKQPLYKTSSVVETPSYPKFVRRTNSFQSENAKYCVTRKLLETCSEQESMSTKKSIKKTTIMTESSIQPLRSRMSIGLIPSTGNVLSTPLKRSNSLSKHHGTSQISRPSITLTSHKISSAKKDPQLSLLQRPSLSTSSRIRFCSRLDLPSTLPPEMNDNLPRKLFPDLKMSIKR